MSKQLNNALLAIASLFAASLVAGKKVIKWIAPVTAKLSSPYGNRTIKGQTQFHNGIDFHVPGGTEIKSPADGIVIKVYEGTAGGKQMLIKHTNGFITGYAHLSNWAKQVNDKVKQGDIIAYSGNTGTATTGAHLHFTMRDAKGKLVNPAKYLKV